MSRVAAPLMPARLIFLIKNAGFWWLRFFAQKQLPQARMHVRLARLPVLPGAVSRIDQRSSFGLCQASRLARLLDFLRCWARFLYQSRLSKNGNWFPLIVVYTASVHTTVLDFIYRSGTFIPGSRSGTGGKHSDWFSPTTTLSPR